MTTPTPSLGRWIKPHTREARRAGPAESTSAFRRAPLLQTNSSCCFVAFTRPVNSFSGHRRDPGQLCSDNTKTPPELRQSGRGTTNALLLGASLPYNTGHPPAGPKATRLEQRAWEPQGFAGPGGRPSAGPHRGGRVRSSPEDCSCVTRPFPETAAPRFLSAPQGKPRAWNT